MPLSVDNFIQSKTGGFDGSSGNVTLDAAVASGNAVLVCAVFGTPGGVSPAYQLQPPAGFTQVSGLTGAVTQIKTVAVAFVKRNCGGESSWTFTMLTADQVAWVAIEVGRIDAESPGFGLDPLTEWFVNSGTSSQSYDGGTPATIGSGTTSETSCYDTIAIAVHGARSDNTTPVTWSGQTNGFTEYAESSQVNATNAVSIGVSYLPSLALGTFSSTATLSTGKPACGTVFALYADQARHASKLELIFGAECGTASGLTSGSIADPGFKPIDEIVGTPTITTSTPRTGSYCLELSSSAAAESVAWVVTPDGIDPGTLGRFGMTCPVEVSRFCLYIPTSLPGGDQELASGETADGQSWKLRYRTASGKVGMQIGSGTEQLSDAAISANKHIGFDVRYDPRATTHLLDWAVDYDSLDATGPVAQTQASTTGMTASDFRRLRIGWTTASTFTMRVDDVGHSRSWGAYPLGDLRVVAITVDPTSSATLARLGGGSPDTANFKTFVNNGTMSTWDGAVAVTKVDDIPPVFGGSADGVAQVAFTTGQFDYAEFPMATYTAGADKALRGLRWWVAVWAASGNPGTCGIRSYDGATEYNFVSGDFGQDDTTLTWICAMQRYPQSPYPSYDLTQSRLDAMALRWGYSSDANPDVGVLCVMAEIAYVPVRAVGVTDVNDPFRLYLKMDPGSDAVRGLQLDTPSGQGATLTWTKNGTPGSQHVNANSTWTEPLVAESIADVTAYGLIPD